MVGWMDGHQVEEEWVEVPRPPVAGGLLVNVGDLLRRWTNDSFKSIRHRVVSRPPTHTTTFIKRPWEGCNG